MKAALIENERANDALCHFLEEHRGNARRVMERILEGASPLDMLQIEEVPKLRDEYREHLAGSKKSLLPPLVLRGACAVRRFST